MNQFASENRLRSLVPVLGLVIVLVSLIQINWRRPGIDFLHFWAVPQAMRSEAPDKTKTDKQTCYTPQGRASLLQWLKETASTADGSTEEPSTEEPSTETNNAATSSLASLVTQNESLYAEGVAPTGTPLLYATLGAIQTGQFATDYHLFQLVSTLLMVCGLVALAVTCGAKPYVACAIPLVAALFYQPIIVDAGVANTNRLQVGLIAIALVCCVPSRSSGYFLTGAALLGFVVLFKPNTIVVPVFVAVSIAGQGRLKQVSILSIGCVAGAIIGLSLGAWLFGGYHAWWQWADYLRTADGLYPLEAGNYSLTAMFSVSPIGQIVLASALALIGCGVIAGSGLRPNQNRVCDSEATDSCTSTSHQIMLAGSLGMLVPLLTAPLAWGHYYSLALPTIVLTGLKIAGDYQSVRPDWLAAACWLVATLAVSATPLVSLGLSNPTTMAVSLNLGVLALFALASQQLLRWPTSKDNRPTNAA